MPGYPLPMMYYPPSGFPGALDLATCVYNNDRTNTRDGASGGGICAYSTDGLLAWNSSENTGITYGLDASATPFVLQGGYPTLTTSFNGNNASTATERGGWKFSVDGTKLFTGQTAQVFTLPTPFDVTTRVLASVNTSLDTAASTYCAISMDGLSIYRATPGTVITKWNLSVAWDLTTAVEQPANTITLPANSRGLAISNDQSRLYVVTAGTPDSVWEFVMATPGNLATIPQSLGVAIPNYTLNVSGQGNARAGIYVSYDMKHLLLGGSETSRNTARSYTGDIV